MFSCWGDDDDASSKASREEDQESEGGGFCRPRYCSESSSSNDEQVPLVQALQGPARGPAKVYLSQEHFDIGTFHLAGNYDATSQARNGFKVYLQRRPAPMHNLELMLHNSGLWAVTLAAVENEDEDTDDDDNDVAVEDDSEDDEPKGPDADVLAYVAKPFAM
mmetsp:Transcript_68429/g.164299  ORF Transcript_68429/g.164299 Transcript_68429/m.164299 type:complete len:163 (+) Transcript_68429:124-612(+)